MLPPMGRFRHPLTLNPQQGFVGPASRVRWVWGKGLVVVINGSASARLCTVDPPDHEHVRQELCRLQFSRRNPPSTTYISPPISQQESWCSPPSPPHHHSLQHLAAAPPTSWGIGWGGGPGVVTGLAIGLRTSTAIPVCIRHGICRRAPEEGGDTHGTCRWRNEGGGEPYVLKLIGDP